MMFKLAIAFFLLFATAFSANQTQENKILIRCSSVVRYVIPEYDDGPIPSCSSLVIDPVVLIQDFFTINHPVINNQSIKPDRTLHTCCSGKKTFLPVTVFTKKKSSIKRSDGLMSQMFPNYEGGCLIWFRSSTDIVLSGHAKYMRVSRGHFSVIENCSATSGLIETGYCIARIAWPSDLDLTPTTITAVGYMNSTLGEETSLCVATREVPGKAVCDIYVGFICCPSHKNLCKFLYNFDIWFIVLFFIILFFLIYSGVLLTCCNTCARQSVKTVFTYFRRTPKDANPKKNDTPSIIMSQKQSKAHSAFKFNFTPLVLFCLICTVSSCDESILLSTNHLNCHYEGTSEICVTEIDAIITVPFVGSTICLNVNTPNNIKTIFELTYNSLPGVAGTDFLYRTYDGTYALGQQLKCPYTQECWAGQCQDDTSYTFYDEFGRDLADYSHINRCYGASRWDPIVGGGCFLEYDSCIYYTLAFMPGAEFDVFTITSVHKTPNVTIMWPEAIEAGLGDKPKIETLDRIPKTIYNMDWSILGTLDSDVSFLNNKKLIVSPWGSFFDYANDPNVRSCAGFGSVQCTGPTQCNLPLDCFQFDQAEGKLIAYGPDPTLSAPSYCEGPDEPCLLPNIYGSMILSKYGERIDTLDLNPPPVMISLRTKEPYTFSTQTDLVCPFFDIITCGGVRRLDSRAWIKISVFSSCASGIAYVNSTACQLASPTITIGQEPSEVVIRMTCLSSMIGDLTIFKRDKTATKSFSCVIVDDSADINATSYTTDNITHGILFSSGSLPGWLVTLINIVIVVAIVLASSALIGSLLVLAFLIIKKFK